MKQHLIFLLVSLIGVSAFAQQARVIKTKGYQAIVQFPEGEKPRVGQVIEIGGDSGVDPERPMAGGTRAHSVSVSANLGFMSSSTSGGGSSDSRTEIGIAGRYGWNYETWEAGPIGTLSYTSRTNSSDRVIQGGGFFDYNFVPNKSGTVVVWGLGASAQVGQTSTAISGSETSSTVMDFFGGANAKWFGLNDAVAVRVDGGLAYKTYGPSGSTTTDIGFKALGGLAFYF